MNELCSILTEYILNRFKLILRTGIDTDPMTFISVSKSVKYYNNNNNSYKNNTVNSDKYNKSIYITRIIRTMLDVLVGRRFTLYAKGKYDIHREL